VRRRGHAFYANFVPISGPEIDGEVAAGYPDGIEGVVLHQSSGGAAIERHPNEMGDTVIGDRVVMDWASAPRWETPEARVNSATIVRVAAIGLHDVKQSAPALLNREAMLTPVGRDGWAPSTWDWLASHSCRAVIVGELQDALAGRGGRNVQKIIGNPVVGRTWVPV